MNRALNDYDLSDKAFRMLYTITNYCSLKNSNSVEVHNAHLMMVLNISERWVRKITNELVEKGYITKRINGTSQNKLANTYTLIDVEVNDTPTDSLCNDTNKGDKNVPLKIEGNKNVNKSDAQKFPLKNNNKINKNNKLIDLIDNNINTGNIKAEINNNSRLLDDDTNTYVDNINTNSENEIILISDGVDNINADNSNVEFRNREIEMNEERMNVMNELKETVDVDNTNIPTLSEVLEMQANEDNEIFNTSNVSICNASSDNSVNHFNKEEQERYTRLYASTKELIQSWYKSHDSIIRSRIENNISIIKMMYECGDISRKQFETSETNLKNYFNKLMNGYLQLLKNKRNPIISNNNPQPPRPEENENKAVLSRSNGSDIEVINESKETQQDANKRAKMAIVERECKAPNKKFNFDTMEMIVNYINSFVESRQEKEEWINRYFNGITHKEPLFLDAMKNRALSKI